MVPLINHPVPILQSSHVLMRSCPRVSWCSTLTLTPDRGRVSPQPHYMAWGATAHVIGAITAALRQNRITPFATLRALQLLFTPPWPGRGLLLLLLLSCCLVVVFLWNAMTWYQILLLKMSISHLCDKRSEKCHLRQDSFEGNCHLGSVGRSYPGSRCYGLGWARCISDTLYARHLTHCKDIPCSWRHELVSLETEVSLQRFLSINPLG